MTSESQISIFVLFVITDLVLARTQAPIYENFMTSETQMTIFMLFVLTELVLAGTQALISKNSMTSEAKITLFCVICDNIFGFSQDPSTP